MFLKRKSVAIILILSMIISTSITSSAAVGSFGDYDDIRSKDISTLDLRSSYDVLCTLEFDKNTIWPSVSNMPQNFSPTELMEWGKKPGLGINELHNLGYTGKGVNVAYIDQPLGSQVHPECSKVDLHYYTDTITKYQQNKRSSMHGSAVLSLLAGKDIGVAPDASVYYVADPSWLLDQSTNAMSIRKIIEINKTLADSEKIKVIGFSDNINPSDKNPAEFQKAVKEAEAEGIYVLFCGEFSPAVATPFSDRDVDSNYTALNYDTGKLGAYINNQLYIPVDRTIASESLNYIKYYKGGLSWTTPYVVGLMAIGWQINPTLSAVDLLKLMKTTATGTTGGGLINPKGFVKAVQNTMNLGVEDYIVFIYNSLMVSDADLNSIKAYGEKVVQNETIEYIDVKGLSSASSIYLKIKGLVENKKGKLLGVQIFGTNTDVAAFNINYKAQVENGIDDKGSYLSDYFYGNVDNDISVFNGISVYDVFNNKTKVDFLTEWPVVRLPITKGDYSSYFTKYYDYSNKVKNTGNIKLVNFSNPIFKQIHHIDDMGWFIENRMNKEFGILTATQYDLYGNLEAEYPVEGNVTGDFSADNLSKINKIGITDILINTHSQKTNIDKAIFENGIEKRISIMNTNNINSVLGSNYYNLMLWSCNSAHDFDNANLTYKALAQGKALNAFAATTILSNNGVNNKATLDKMKENNFFYFYYSYMKYYYGGVNRSTSFFLAQRDYVRTIIDNSDTLIYEKNYQYNMNNVLTYEHLGLLVSNEPNMGDGVILSKAGKLVNNTTLIPMRVIFETLGYDVLWDQTTKTVTASNSQLNKTIKLSINDVNANVNGQILKLTTAPQILNNLTYVPLRFISEASGCNVSWDNSIKTASVYAKSGNDLIKYLVKTEAAVKEYNVHIELDTNSEK